MSKSLIRIFCIALFVIGFAPHVQAQQQGIVFNFFNIAPEGAEYVISRYRDANVNLRTHLLRILHKAGVEPWPRLFQNLRASRGTDLANTFPLHVVTAWLGNTPKVADKHYLQVTPAHFAQAVAGPERGGAGGGAQVVQQLVPQPAAGSRNGRQEMTQQQALMAKTPVFPEVSGFSEYTPQGSNL